MTPLFRPEAVRAQHQLWLGRVQVTRPLSLSWLVAGICALAVLTAVFLSLGQYTRKAQVGGALAPDKGLIRLVPTVPGTVLSRHVVEGQLVRADELLFVLAQDRDGRDDVSQDELRRNVTSRLRNLEDAARQQRALAEARIAALTRRLAALDAETHQLASELALHQRRSALARQTRARWASLQDQAFISPAQLQSKDEEILALEAQQRQVERQGQSLARERAEIDGERVQVPLELAAVLSALSREQAELTREGTLQAGVRRVEVRALQAGTVGAVLAEPGQVVAAPMALATLVPEGSVLQAHLFAPSRAVGFIKPGQVVRLRLEAYPYQKYGHLSGQVLDVSRTPLAAAELVGQAGMREAAEPMYRITVRLLPADAARTVLPLSVGMRLSADVQLDRRRLVEWLFEPVLGLEERL